MEKGSEQGHLKASQPLAADDMILTDTAYPWLGQTLPSHHGPTPHLSPRPAPRHLSALLPRCPTSCHPLLTGVSLPVSLPLLPHQPWSTTHTRGQRPETVLALVCLRTTVHRITAMPARPHLVRLRSLLQTRQPQAGPEQAKVLMALCACLLPLPRRSLALLPSLKAQFMLS